MERSGLWFDHELSPSHLPYLSAFYSSKVAFFFNFLINQQNPVQKLFFRLEKKLLGLKSFDIFYLCYLSYLAFPPSIPGQLDKRQNRIGNRIENKTGANEMQYANKIERETLTHFLSLMLILLSLNLDKSSKQFQSLLPSLKDHFFPSSNEPNASCPQFHF